MNYQQMIHNHQNLWDAYTKHSFVRQLISKELPPSSFRHYLLQDFVFLKKSAHLFIQLREKTHDPVQRYIIEQYQDVFALEIPHHTHYFTDQGFTEQDFKWIALAEGTQAYCDFLEQESQSLQAIDFFMALAPCVIGYAEIGRTFDPTILTSDHPYRCWLEVYSCQTYQMQAKKIESMLTKELLCLTSKPQALNRMVQKFKQACQLEVGFWEQSLGQ